jgi:hypothetical protein
MLFNAYGLQDMHKKHVIDEQLLFGGGGHCVPPLICAKLSRATEFHTQIPLNVHWDLQLFFIHVRASA